MGPVDVPHVPEMANPAVRSVVGACSPKTSQVVGPAVVSSGPETTSQAVGPAVVPRGPKTMSQAVGAVVVPPAPSLSASRDPALSTLKFELRPHP